MSYPKETPGPSPKGSPKIQEWGQPGLKDFWWLHKSQHSSELVKPVPLYQKETFPFLLTEGSYMATCGYQHIKAHAGITSTGHTSKSMLAPPLVPNSLELTGFPSPATLTLLRSCYCVLSQVALVRSSLAVLSP